MSDVLIKHELIIGVDFLNTIEMTIKAGEISFCQLSELSPVEKNIPEIIQIDVDQSNEIDVSHGRR